MIYTSDYVRVVTEQVKAVPPDFLSKDKIEMDMRVPPLIEQLKAMDEAARLGGEMSTEMKDHITHLSVLGREVRVSYEDKLVGSFVSNSENDSWDNFPVMTENPPVLSLLHDLCVFAIMSKWSPPRASTQPAAANLTPGQSR
jgi:hypothetical protein